ncbi:DUF3040 domain-containing protein [Rudaeicoccus suwonensis]|uniref:DUF3040 family protein n=1 Tax=Rudaeicoccus suwonensis TaxID=657409 RepID=A0A561EBM2_9MICO|nr:DUF3040 domain-containing protein [Rudaeicoccus suwonensis]TWE12997.1 DUF3040 family protein [Rudaeicoccus suwonensis]
MPLSEHEQRLLDQMEQALKAEDPKFASHMVSSRLSHRLGRRAVIGGFGVLAGLALVLVGVMSAQIWVGAIGFACMVAAGAYGLTPGRTQLGTVQADGSVTPAAPARRPSVSSRQRTTGSFMQRLEQRWDRRRGMGGW